MSITFKTQAIAEYAKEFPSITDFEDAICSICRYSIKTTEQTLIWTHGGVGESRHAHHIECLTPWLAINNCCPCCQKKNIPSWKQQALTISERVLVNGLGSGLMVGTFGCLNNACFDFTGPHRSLLWTENNTLFAGALMGGTIESLIHFSIPFENSLYKTRLVTLAVLTSYALLSNTQNPLIAFGATGTMLLATIATHCLHKAGATMRGLTAPMVVASCISSLTSSQEIPLPTLPLTAVAMFLGIIGSIKKD